MKRAVMAGLLLAAAAAIYGGADAAVPNTVENIGSFREGSTPTFTFRFRDAPKCAGGAQAGAVCTTNADCPGSTCNTAAAAATSMTYRVTYGSTAILAPVTIAPGAAVVTVTLPSSATAISDGGLPSNVYRLSVAWTSVCAAGADAGDACDADNDCAGSFCVRGADQADYSVVGMP